ncbi:hypothetical protein ACHAPT_008331 [Fusarium lateritium]
MANEFKGLVGPLLHRCAQCLASSPRLIRCSACLAVRYCSHEHEAAHRSQHESVCNKIKEARTKLAKEEDRVGNVVTGSMAPADAFEMHADDVWNHGSRYNKYLDARFALAERLRLLGTLDGVQEAFGHVKDMLMRGRPLLQGELKLMVLQDVMPAMMLRLDLDQECYDFVKWRAARGKDDRIMPYLGADVLEEPDFMGESCFDAVELSCGAAVLLLKLKLLVDIRNLKMTRKVLVSRRLPYDTREAIELSVLRSPLSVKLRRESPDSLLTIATRLMDQTRQLGTKLVELHNSFMFCLLDPDEALCVKRRGRGSRFYTHFWKHTAVHMQNLYAAWWETEGVLDMLNAARACAARDAEDEVEDMMKAEEQNLGSRTAEQVLWDASVDAIWGYLDWAVEDASHWGPWSERPSERHLRQRREAWARAKETRDMEKEEELDRLLGEWEWDGDENKWEWCYDEGKGECSGDEGM